MYIYIYNYIYVYMHIEIFHELLFFLFYYMQGLQTFSPGAQLKSLSPQTAKLTSTLQALNGSFRILGVPYFGVLIIRILLFRILY